MLRQTYVLAGCALALAIALSPIHAQVVAHQGVDTEKPVEFTSPMVLELPFKKAAKFPEGTGQAFDDLSKFVCDDTLVTRLSAKKVRASAKRGDRYAFDGTIFVRRSHDRRVSLTLEILVGPDQLAIATKAGIDAEENSSRIFNLQLSLTPDGSAKLARNPEASVLRLTVKVEDND